VAEPLPLPIELRWLAAFLLFILLPGWLLVSLLRPTRTDERLEIALLIIASGYSLAMLLGLALHAVFQPVAPWQIAAGGGLLVLALALAAARRSSERKLPSPQPEVSPSPSPSRPTMGPLYPHGPVRGRGLGGEGFLRRLGTPELLARSWPILLILAVAAPLRLLDLGWSEFQGDEARVVLRAMAALQGADGALAAHRKVPGEILLTYLFAGSVGQIVEQIARLPFALAGVGAVLAFYSLARKLLGGAAALVAGLLLAVNGYFVAFGRILQYDSLSFFLGIAGLLCCWRFGQAARDSGAGDRAPSRRDDHAPFAWAFLASLLLSGAALVALGAVFLVPPALLLAWPGLVQHARSWRGARSWQILVAWGWPIVPALLAAGMVLGVSGPSDGPSGIWSYLGPRLGGDRPYWHGALFLRSANHYLSSPYLLVMLGAGALAMVLGILGVARTRGTRGIVIRLIVAILLAALTWDHPRAAVAIGALLALALVLQRPGQRPGNPLGMRVALVWAAGPLFVHLLLIRVPGTHFREAFPGLILILAALAVPALARPRSRLVVGALLAALVFGAGHYSWVTLVQRQPEYQLTYPANRHPLDWTDWDGRGIGGVFGTVHRHGWKALGVIVADGGLPGGYATNESPAISAWYLRRPQGCAGALAYVFRVQRAPHDRNLVLPVPLPAGYQTRGQVREQRRPTIAIQVPPSSTERFGEIPAEAYEDRFNRELASSWRPVGELYRADLGAATARRSCVARNQPSRDSVNAG
jgi:4-amino-4-deoxy-L-arabinose transferase-like glycosyltransferase